jgi:predicted RNA-binding protein YlxR (DUF448 family)
VNAESRRPVLRRCCACRRLADRREFWRVIRRADGSGLALDEGMGRSAYLCQEPACLEEARRRKRLQRALRCQVADSIISALEQRLGRIAPAAAEAR